MTSISYLKCGVSKNETIGINETQCICPFWIITIQIKYLDFYMKFKYLDRGK